jgi:hypothetical protein
MTLHIRLIEIERYVPGVNNTTDLSKAFSPLKRYCRDQVNIALTLAPWSEVDRGEAALVILGIERPQVETEARHLEEWMEANLEGQSLRLEASWL